MGCGESRNNYKDYHFSQEEVDRIEKIFRELADSNPSTRGKNQILKESFNEFFYDNPFGKKLYKFFLRYSDSNTLNFRTFLKGVELLCKDHEIKAEKQELNHDKYFELNKIDLFFIIINSSCHKEFLQAQFSTKDLHIGYEQALNFMISILKIFNLNSTEQKISEEGAKAVIDTIFRTEFGQIDYWTFMMVIKEQLFYLNNVLRYYFETKFQRYSVKYHLPQLDSPSEILSKEFITLLYLSNTYMQSSHELKFIYSTTKQGFDFNALAKSLINFKGPTLILIKSKSQSNSNQDKEKYCIYGGFNTQWKNDSLYQGSQESYIFSMTPKFHNFFPNQLSDSQNSNQYNNNKNYAYLCSNRGGGKNGIGFGGSLDQSRIWIDENIQQKSSTNHMGETYKNGYLTDPKVQSQIVTIEVWGLTKNEKRATNIQSNQRIVSSYINQQTHQSSSYIRNTTNVQDAYNSQNPEQAIYKSSYNDQPARSNNNIIDQIDNYQPPQFGYNSQNNQETNNQGQSGIRYQSNVYEQNTYQQQ